MAAMASDRMAAESMGEGRGDDRGDDGGDGGGRLSLPHEARERSATIGRVRADARQSRVGRRAGKQARARNHLPFAASWSRWSCWSPEDVAASASAQHEDDVGTAMAVDGDTGGGKTRAVQGEVVSRSRAQRAARVRGGRRAQRRGAPTCPPQRSFQTEQLPGIATQTLVIARQPARPPGPTQE